MSLSKELNLDNQLGKRKENAAQSPKLKRAKRALVHAISSEDDNDDEENVKPMQNPVTDSPPHASIDTEAPASPKKKKKKKKKKMAAADSSPIEQGARPSSTRPFLFKKKWKRVPRIKFLAVSAIRL